MKERQFVHDVVAAAAAAAVLDDWQRDAQTVVVHAEVVNVNDWQRPDVGMLLVL